MASKNEIADRFTEVVARTLDVYDQQQDGKYPPFDHDRWEKRYTGRSFGELPVGMIVFNNFRPLVDLVVSQLVMAMDDEEWLQGHDTAFAAKQEAWVEQLKQGTDRDAQRKRNYEAACFAEGGNIAEPYKENDE